MKVNMEHELVAAERGKPFISIAYTTSVPTSQTTQSVSIIKTSRLMLFRGVVGTCYEYHTKHTNKLLWQNADFLNVTVGVTCIYH